MMNFVLKRIKAEGPLQSKDFKRETKSSKSGWWDWKPAKKALERLFLDGDLEVSYRDSFRKVYDLPENVIPSNVDTTQPTELEYYEYLIHRTLRHHGFANITEMGYLARKEVKQSLKRIVESLVENGQLIGLQVKGVNENYYTYPKFLNKKITSTSNISILSPFDNLVIQRKKLENIFNYKYQIECYVPEPKRQYGYFCLPIFKGVKPIGRIDCRADRKEKILIIKSLHSETKSKIDSTIKARLNDFAKFNGCNTINW